MRILSRTGVEMLHGRIADLEKRVAELQENFQAIRMVLEIIRDTVMERADDDKA